MVRLFLVFLFGFIAESLASDYRVCLSDHWLLIERASLVRLQADFPECHYWSLKIPFGIIEPLHRLSNFDKIQDNIFVLWKTSG